MAGRERARNNVRIGRESKGARDDAARIQEDGVAAGGGDARTDTAPEYRNEDVRRAEIALAAYYNAERRGFGGNRELEDWLQAEREVLNKAARMKRPR